VKQILVLTANVKFPSSNSFYLTSNSYVVEESSMEDINTSMKNFREEVEQEGFEVIGLTAHIVPTNKVYEVLKSLHQ
jgi:hypothetical protein